MTACRCDWCDKPYERRAAGGSAQRFCSALCRAGFHRALHDWAARQIEAGAVTVASLRGGTASSVYASPSAKSPGGASQEGAAPAPLEGKP